jgi:hypothetical protein
MKMVKRTLIAIAVVAFVVSSAQAVIQLDNGAVKEDNGWPTQYIAVPLCTMPVVMDVGMYVQVIDCGDKKIELKQVTCPSGRDFPCYSGCAEDIEVRANFNAVLGTQLAADPCVPSFSWEAKFVGDSTIPGDGINHKITVCVEAWAMEIWKAGPNDSYQIGELTLTVKPQ